MPHLNRTRRVPATSGAVLAQRITTRGNLRKSDHAKVDQDISIACSARQSGRGCADHRKRESVGWACKAGRVLADAGHVDGRRTMIVGPSAGGFTALCALAHPGSFVAAGSYHGIADLETFAREAPKFQSHYLDQLVGPYPEAAAEYRARSPLHFADRVSGPVIMVAGCEDPIVPTEQIESMVKALQRAGVKYVWLPFKGEGHGLRRPGNIQEALERELRFYLDALNLAG